MEEKSEIAKFYDDRTILITGATGLIGKVLIWKLLHSCPNIDIIYVLIRSKRGKDAHRRLAEILQTPMFDNFRRDNPKMLEKCRAVSGDIGELQLGLSEEDEKKLIDNVNIVFHIAAMLKLDAELKDAINMNAEGTHRMLQLSSKMSNLIAFVHTSTAYCHCDIPIMEEKVYPAAQDPFNVINLAKWMKPELFNSISENLMKPHPNSYTYTKRLAENVVAEFHPTLPVAIARPSIVIPAWKEPIPGWVDNLNGPTGLLVGAGKGVIRTMHCNGQYIADLTPVDIVCNAHIAIPWKINNDRSRYEGSIPVFNLTQTDIEPVKWQEVVDLGKKVAAEYPFETVLWFPGGDVYSNFYVHTILAILFHWIPAYFIDFIMLLLGKKRFLVQIQKRIHHGQKLLRYFTTREWNFLKDNLINLKESLSPVDRTIFQVTMEGLERKPFMINSSLAARRYVLKEDPDSMEKSRSRIKIFYAADCIVKGLFCLFVFGMILNLSGIASYIGLTEKIN